MHGVKNYKLYGFDHDDDIVRSIISSSAHSKDLRFYIEIIPSKVDELTTKKIEKFLQKWDDIKQYIHWIALGNEPILAHDISLNTLSEKLQMLCTHLSSKNGWKHVSISIPFSAEIFEKSYPVTHSIFKVKYNKYLTEILKILQANNGVFSINLYPYFTANDEHKLLEYCIGNETDLTGKYESMLAAQYDATCYALNDLIPNNGVEIIISETGWATKGGTYGSTKYAKQYYENVCKSMNNPLSRLHGVNIFFFELFDEDNKPNGEWERNFGIFDKIGNKKWNDSKLFDCATNANNANDDEGCSEEKEIELISNTKKLHCDHSADSTNQSFTIDIGETDASFRNRIYGVFHILAAAFFESV